MIMGRIPYGQYWRMFRQSTLRWGLFGLLLLVHLGCSSDSAFDCFQNAGETVRDEVVVPDFSKITVFENVRLIVKEGPVQKVEVETGAFLRNEVSATVDDGRLLLRDSNGCNFVRDYGLTTVYVTSPELTEIRSSTGLPIGSDGVLGYDEMTLISESFLNTESETTDGEFDLDLNVGKLSIIVNGITYFKLRGAVTDFNVQIAAGDSRIEAENLTAGHIVLDHRGTNDLFINPRQSLKGVIRGTGDVISSNRPAEIEVELLFNGKLIFKD